MIVLVYIGLARTGRWPSIVAAYPEYFVLPHGVRAMGFCIGDTVVGFVAMSIALAYRYETSIAIETTYLELMTGAVPYALWGGAVLRVATVAVVALLFERLNVFYWICLGRCGTEWDSMHGLPLGQRQDEI